jgi:hypothetical protein
VYYAKPSSPFGYYRGNPVFNGDGSNQGANVSGMNVFSSGQGSAAGEGTSAWSPTILYLFVLVLIEMFVFAWVARHI